tara:strand:- start:7041 stop:8813 length:1773 start_codon:yes stop_codon:yes gene_type:complete
MNIVDWTQIYDRKVLIDRTQIIIDRILDGIHQKKYKIFIDNKFSKYEISLVFRWPIYISVNTFVERYFRSIFSEKKNLNIVKKSNSKYQYFLNSNLVTENYYNNISLNQKLINDINRVLFEKDFNYIEKKDFNNYDINKNKFLFSFFRKKTVTFNIRLKSFIDRKYKNFYSSILQKIKLPTVFYQGDKQFSKIYSLLNRFPEMNYKSYQINKYLRNDIKKISEKIFIEEMSEYFSNFDNNKINQLSILFGIWVDRSIPLSIIEGISDKLDFYKQLVDKNTIKEVHSSIGYYANDNFKIFALLAKRKKAILIAQDDGISNFCSLYPNNNLPNQYKLLNEIMFVDYYCSWGIKNNDIFDNVENNLKTKIINTGSVYLKNIKKKYSNKLNNKKIKILILSGPLRLFMSTLEEITPEYNFDHKRNVLKFIKRIIKEYPNFEFFYKPFPGIDDKYDPIHQLLKNEIDNRVVRITNMNAINLMKKVDVAIFDTISTGFAEAIRIGVPSLVFLNQYEYNIASNIGKKMNDEMHKKGLLFFDENTGLKSFKYLFNNLKDFQKKSDSILKEFQEIIAYPVDSVKFHKTINNFLLINELK